MIVAGSASPLLLSSGGYNLTKSLRFRSSASAYLNRTPASTTNRTTWTWSGWLKRGLLGSGLYTPYCFGDNSTGSTDVGSFLRINGDVIEVSEAHGGVNSYLLSTTQVFRDPSAWYHIVVVVDTTQATASNRVKLYVNGSQVTAFTTATYPSLNFATSANVSGNTNYLGVLNLDLSSNTQYFDGYMTEINFIDGQALTPSSFGQTSASTGVWIPKKYTGTYGTNGFYLPFTNTTSTTTLGNDFSGNGNNWTTNNISLTSGATYDSMTDVPTLTSPTAANYAVLNPIISASGTVSNGNLTLTAPASNYTYERPSTIAVSTGKWYAEYTVTSGGGGYYPGIGAVPDTEAFGSTFTPGVTAVGYGIRATGEKYNNSTMSAYGVSYTNGDIVGVALDLTNGKIYFSKNGTWMNSGDPSAGTNPAFTGLSGSYCLTVAHYDSGVVNCNFGQRPFAYTPPTGFVALNTFNLPTPTIGATASSQANKYIDIKTYTGTGSSLNITGLGFQPDLVWIKERNAAADHALYDAVRGVQKQLESNTTTDETTESTGLTAFNSDGFTVGSLAQVNTNTDTYVAWNWKESATSGFDIVTYTGNGTARTISHNLGVAPDMIIVKARTTAGTDQGWPVYHSYNTTAPETDYLLLNSDAATADLDTVWNDTNPTSSVFSVGTNALVNTNNDTYVAYLFAEVAGYSAFGSYTGNGSTDGPFIYTGFRPKYVMVKCSSSNQAGNAAWFILDSARNTYNVENANLYANLSNAEAAADRLDFVSNGFKIRTTSTGFNASSATYIYACFAESPFKYANAR